MNQVGKKSFNANSHSGSQPLLIALVLWVVCSQSFMAAMSISMGIFLLVSAWTIFRVWRGADWWNFLLHSAYARATFFLLFTALLSVIVSYFDPPFPEMKNSFHELPKKFVYFLLPPLTAYSLLFLSERRGQRIDQLPIWSALFAMSFFVSILGILQFWGSWIFPKEWLEWRFFRPVAWSRHHHAQGLMFFHLSYATALSFSLAYSVARFFWRPVGDSLKKWLFHGAVGFFSAMAIYYSFSRISWLAILLTIFLLGFLRKKVLGYLLVLLLGVAGLSLWVLDHDFRQRALDVVGMEGRVIVWKNSMAMVKDRPLTGVGFGKTGQFSEQYAIRVFGKEQWFASHAHNNFLDALAATGLIGFTAFAIWWIVFFIYAWRIYRSTENSQKWLPAALLIAGIGFQINGLTQVNFYDAKSQHSLCLWAGLVLALEYLRQKSIQSHKN